MKDRKLLMIPGPIEFEPAVLAALGAPTTSHLAPNFMEAFGGALERMRDVFLCDDGQPFVLAGSGTLAMDSAVEGQPEGLSAEAYGAVAWIEAAIAAGGNEPGIPPVGVDLSSKQREHLVYVARLELVVHSAGLIFLPRHLIVRALGEPES